MADNVLDLVKEKFGDAGCNLVARPFPLWQTPIASNCGSDCKKAIDGVWLVIETIDVRGPDREILIRRCIEAVECMVCG